MAAERLTGAEVFDSSLSCCVLEHRVESALERTQTSELGIAKPRVERAIAGCVSLTGVEETRVSEDKYSGVRSLGAKLAELSPDGALCAIRLIGAPILTS